MEWHTPDEAMTDHPTQSESRVEAPGVRSEPAVSEGIASTDAYEVDDGTVLFDVENPLAWVEADRTVPVARMV